MTIKTSIFSEWKKCTLAKSLRKGSLLCTENYTVALTMTLTLDGNLEIGTHVSAVCTRSSKVLYKMGHYFLTYSSNLFCLIYLRHLIKSREVTNRIFFYEKNLFSFMRAQNVMSYHLI